MEPQYLYTGCVLGAIGLYLCVRPGKRTLRMLGGIIALAGFGWLLANAPAAFGVEDGEKPEIFFLIFSVIALSAAVRMITHSRPVFSALYFVMVVLSSAGLFLLLAAEFMTFALIIVYAGAILITYLFVLMLAQQAPDPDNPEGHAEYDLFPREPAAAALVGFIMLALLSDMIFQGGPTLPPPRTGDQITAAAWARLEEMPKKLEAVIDAEVEADHDIDADESGHRIRFVDDDGNPIEPSVRVTFPDPDRAPEYIALPEDALPTNPELVGMALVADFPVSLELAGVILLMAMFGAVVLARRQIELGEDEKREAAGMTPLDEHGLRAVADAPDEEAAP